jgi:DNA replication protein DnaC
MEFIQQAKDQFLQNKSDREYKLYLSEVFAKNPYSSTMPFEKFKEGVLLTDEETPEILSLARHLELTHNSKQKHRNYSEIVTQDKRIDVKADLFRKHIDHILKKRNPGYQVTGYTLTVFDCLCAYFLGDQSFEKMGDGFSLDKGLLIQGPIGCGKTSLLTSFNLNPVRCFIVKNASEVVSEFNSSPDHNKTGFDVLDKYSKLFQPTYLAKTEWHRDSETQSGLFIDDLGTEEMGRIYGQNTDVIAEIITRRYSAELPFNGLHTTTNLTADGLGSRYGQRVRSRMSEMFNILRFPTDAIDHRRK